MDRECENDESACRRKYSDGQVYKSESISVLPGGGPDCSFSEKILAERIRMVQKHCTGPNLLDLCCGNGLHLSRIFGDRSLGVGLDFSEPFLRYAMNHRPEKRSGLTSFVCASARRLPFRDESFHGAYSISSLVHVPDVWATLAEVRRVLVPGGRFVFDLGNADSLNHIVVRHHPETAKTFHMPVGRMLEMIRGSGLAILEHRAFQILPYWGGEPRWMRPLLRPAWARWMGRSVAGKLLDEWACCLPGLRRAAYRHVFACAREAQ
jgi:SAM-dependent methyltransferase